MSNKLFLLISFLVIASGMAGVYSYLSALQIQQVRQDPPPSASTNTITQKNSTTLKQTKNNIAKQSDQNKINPLAITQTKSLSILNVWYELDPSAVISDIHLDDRITIDKRLGIHEEYLNMIKVGHMLEIPSSGENRYLIKLTDKKKIGGKFELHGEMRDQGRIFFSNFSIAKNNIYGLIETPEGEFNLRMSKGMGYLYKADQLDKYTGEDANKPEVITDIPGFLD